MWAVNYDVLEPYVARPVVHGYARYIPQGMKDGIETWWKTSTNRAAWSTISSPAI